jgi:hypothetical protein
MTNVRMGMAALGAALALAGCQADREATDGVPLDRPEAIEQAPAAPIPAQPLGPPAGSAPPTGDTLLSLPQADTMQHDTLRQPGARPQTGTRP